jgi:hypothetical protein
MPARIDFPLFYSKFEFQAHGIVLEVADQIDWKVTSRGR